MAGTNLTGTVVHVERRELLRRSAAAGVGFSGAMIISSKVGATVGSPATGPPPFVDGSAIAINFLGGNAAGQAGNFPVLEGNFTLNSSFRCIPSGQTGGTEVLGIGQVQYRATVTGPGSPVLTVEAGVTPPTLPADVWHTSSGNSLTGNIHLRIETGGAAGVYTVVASARYVCCYDDSHLDPHGVSGPTWICSSSTASIDTDKPDAWSISSPSATSTAWDPGCSGTGLPC